MAATPGRFCEAMVTTNNGSARLTIARQVNTGSVKTGVVSPHCTAPRRSWPLNAAKSVPTASTPTTA
jgi:hypothetical protein